MAIPVPFRSPLECCPLIACPLIRCQVQRTQERWESTETAGAYANGQGKRVIFSASILSPLESGLYKRLTNESRGTQTMPLPIRTGPADIEAICGYLITKPTGATPAEARAVLDDKALDGRKL